MKKIIYLLLILMSHSLHADFQIQDPEYTEVDNAILRVAVVEDKKQDNFRSAIESREAMYTLTTSVPLFRRPPGVLYQLLRNKDDVQDSVSWARAILKNKYAKGEERLKLARAVYEAAIKKNIFKKSDSLLDCKSRTVVSQGERSNSFVVSFYPSIKPDKPLWARASSVEAANSEIAKFFEYNSIRGTELGEKHVSGILFVWNQTELQACEIRL